MKYPNCKYDTSKNIVSKKRKKVKRRVQLAIAKIWKVRLLEQLNSSYMLA